MNTYIPSEEGPRTSAGADYIYDYVTWKSGRRWKWRVKRFNKRTRDEERSYSYHSNPFGGGICWTHLAARRRAARQVSKWIHKEEIEKKDAEVLSLVRSRVRELDIQ